MTITIEVLYDDQIMVAKTSRKQSIALTVFDAIQDDSRTMFMTNEQARKVALEILKIAV